MNGRSFRDLGDLDFLIFPLGIRPCNCCVALRWLAMYRDSAVVIEGRDFPYRLRAHECGSANRPRCARPTARRLTGDMQSRRWNAHINH